MSPEKRETIAKLRAQWDAFTTRFNINPKGQAMLVMNDIVSHYGQPHRYYHDLTHPSELIELLSLTREVRPEWFAHRETDLAIELSLWLHDYDYETGSKENEVKSGVNAFQIALRLGLGGKVAARSDSIILATDYSTVTTAPSDFAACIVRDIDLSTLAAPWKRFKLNSANVRKEYSEGYPSISDEQFESGRKGFMENMLKWPFIYSTQYFRNLYEDRARANMTRSLNE